MTHAAKMATKDDSKERAGFLFHTVSKYELKPGDHIYAYRAGGVYAHHGIYIGEPRMEVIHFSGQRGKLKGSISISPCTYKKFTEGDCLVHLVAYDVSFFTSLFMRSETAHQYKSRPAKDVVKTAKYYLKHPQEFGKYHYRRNNCESFAIYCKTKLKRPSSLFTTFTTARDGLVALLHD